MAVWNSVNVSFAQESGRTDAEYFRPSYLAALERVSLCQSERISALATVTDGIHGSPVVSEIGIRYISAKCVKDNEFTIDGCIRISHWQHDANPRTQLRKDDVIITTVGTIGNVAVVTEEITPSNCDRHVGIIRIKDPNTLPPFYLSTFLNSKYGVFQSLRESAGNVQLNLYIRNIGNILVPRFGDAEFDVGKIAKAAYLCRTESEMAYAKAEQLLETELGLDSLAFQKPLGYVARFSTVGWSETFSAGRIDAQCFAPDGRFYESWLNAHTRCVRLGSLLQGTVKGRQQADADEGSTDYCSIKHISGQELVEVSKCFPQIDTPLSRPNDLLLAITGATIGKIGIIKRYERLVFSGDLLCLRATESIDPHYLLLALDHKIGQVQFIRWITGSTNGHLASRDAARVLVPRLSIEAEAKIAELVKSSLSKRQESEQLLEQAKIRVEQLIEAAVQP